MSRPGPPDAVHWRPVLAAFAALLAGIGIARFAYTPLIPAVIGAGWYTAGETAYLGAANYGGYFLGAIAGGRMPAHWSGANALRAAMLITGLALIACAEPVSFTWFAFWRLVAGITGGLLMTLGPTLVLAAVPPARRGLAGGLLFAGVATGIVASGTLVPLLLESGLRATWLVLGIITLAFTLLAWNQWPPSGPDAPPARDTANLPGTPALRGLYATYALIAFALVPHMFFLVDWVARGLDRGIGTGAACWVLAGAAGLIGPALFGVISDRFGARHALRAGLVVLLVADIISAASGTLAAALGSSILIGAMIPAVASLTLNRIGDLAEETRPARLRAWSGATGAFAAAQAAAAYGYSFLFAGGASYSLLFVLGGCAAVAALLVEGATGTRLRRT